MDEIEELNSETIESDASEEDVQIEDITESVVADNAAENIEPAEDKAVGDEAGAAADEAESVEEAEAVKAEKPAESAKKSGGLHTVFGGFCSFLSFAFLAVWGFIKGVSAAAYRGVATGIPAFLRSAKCQLKTIFGGLCRMLSYFGRSAWNVLYRIASALFGMIFAFCSAFFGAIFGWIAKKMKQPLLDVWCFILTPFAHAYGAVAHAHIRLKKAREHSFKHAVHSALSSFWRFLGGFGELLRFIFNYAAPVISIIFLISLIRYASTLQYAINVEYNGSEIGTIDNEATAVVAQSLIQDKITFTAEDQSLMSTPRFTVTVLNLEDTDEQPVDNSDLLSEIMIETGEVNVVYAYGFYLNDELIGVYNEEDMIQIRDALNARLNLYNVPNAISVEFEDNIVISEGRFIDTVLVAPDDALELINGSTRVEAYYSVQKGDTISKICENLGISREDFDLDNPTLTEGISRGDIVTYHYLEPHLNVVTAHYENYDQVIERATEYVESSKYETYCEILLQHGSDGYENVTALVTEVNGSETDRMIVSRTVLEEMVPRRFRVGTKDNTYLDDTDVIDLLGTFVWPLANEDCYISSMPGWRRWDNSNHMALDIAGIPRGTDIYASCDGKVTFSGTSGAYGKLIIIDHGHGYETYYAHCSELDVSVGDRVEKGDVIGHVGMTGSASGYHLHFELRYNDKRLNPLICLGGDGGHRYNPA